MSVQGTAGKRKHETLMIPQKLEIIMILESGKSQREITTLYSAVPSTIYDIKKWRDQLQSVMASSEGVRDLFKQQTLK
jgi:hypothetical protein